MPRTSRLRALASLCVAGAVAVALAGCGSGGSANTILLYNGQHPELTNALVAAFTHKTGIHVRVRTNDGIVLADQLLEEGPSSPADVYLTENSPELMTLQQHGLLAKLSPRTLSEVPASDSSPTGRWVGIALRVGALAYDPARVAASALPASVLDLARPQWKGRIAVAPTDSDFPPVVGAVIARYGKRQALQWLRGLKRNAQLYQDDEAVVAAVNRGAVATGIINHYYWYRLRVEIGAGATHSKLHFFPNHDAGSIENISGAAVLASSSHRADAQKFVRFLASPAAQRILARGYDFEYPASRSVAPNPQLPPLSSISHDAPGVVALGNDQTAAQLIQQAGLA
jgi:iron(III) transport system substrate-binding protein